MVTHSIVPVFLTVGMRHLQSRKQPESHAELIEYLLDTESDEMTFEVARCRPLLTDEFNEYLRAQIGGCASC